MNESVETIENQIVTFTLDELHYALPLDNVIKVINAVEIRFLPKAPDIITGIINVHGLILPVINIRKRFKLTERETEPDDHMIIADTGRRHVVLLVDSVLGISDLKPDQVVRVEDNLQFAGYLKGVAKTDNGLILIYDLEKFLGIDEEKKLDRAFKLINR